jgi:hypothetical protein
LKLHLNTLVLLLLDRLDFFSSSDSDEIAILRCHDDSKVTNDDDSELILVAEDREPDGILYHQNVAGGFFFFSTFSSPIIYRKT